MLPLTQLASYCWAWARDRAHMHGYARVATSIYIYIYISIGCLFQAAQLEWRIPSTPSRQNGGPGANQCLPSEAERFQVANVGAAIAKQARSSVRPECVPVFFCACVYMFLGESCGPIKCWAAAVGNMVFKLGGSRWEHGFQNLCSAL